MWPHDGDPADILRRVQVRVAGETTADAEEPSLRLPIGLLTMPTTTTGLAGIGRVDVDYQHADQRRLVGHEGPELEERPIVQHAPLARGTVDSAADVLEVFKSDAAPCVFCRADKGLRQTVVDVARKPLLAPTAFPEQPLGRLRTLHLELPPHAAVAGTHLIDVGVPGAGGVVQEFTIRCGREGDDAQVYTHIVLWLIGCRFWRVHGHGQEEHLGALAVEQITLPPAALPHPLGIDAEAERDERSPVQR